MKWPKSVALIRHGQSEYNILRDKKAADPLYQEFKEQFEIDHLGDRTRLLAKQVQKKFALGVSDYNTSLTTQGTRQAEKTGSCLYGHIPHPDVVFVSPYLRTKETFRHMIVGERRLADVKRVYDDRIREQEHGLSLLYNDWRVFHTFHPEQKELHDLMGPYWYQYPQGESVSEVRDRVRLFLDMLIRECAGKNVLVITHHLTILSTRANLERLSPEQFTDLDEKQKPVNCGITLYTGNPEAGSNGRLELEDYNKKLWD